MELVPCVTDCLRHLRDVSEFTFQHGEKVNNKSNKEVLMHAEKRELHWKAEMIEQGTKRALTQSVT